MSWHGSSSCVLSTGVATTSNGGPVYHHHHHQVYHHHMVYHHHHLHDVFCPQGSPLLPTEAPLPTTSSLPVRLISITITIIIFILASSLPSQLPHCHLLIFIIIWSSPKSSYSSGLPRNWYSHVLPELTKEHCNTGWSSSRYYLYNCHHNFL